MKKIMLESGQAIDDWLMAYRSKVEWTGQDYVFAKKILLQDSLSTEYANIGTGFSKIGHFLGLNARENEFPEPKYLVPGEPSNSISFEFHRATPRITCYGVERAVVATVHSVSRSQRKIVVRKDVLSTLENLGFKK